MIVGLMGSVCSGKSILAEYLNKQYGFTIIDLRKELEKAINETT